MVILRKCRAMSHRTQSSEYDRVRKIAIALEHDPKIALNSCPYNHFRRSAVKWAVDYSGPGEDRRMTPHLGTLESIGNELADARTKVQEVRQSLQTAPQDASEIRQGSCSGGTAES
jgi:hypothetical protein